MADTARRHRWLVQAALWLLHGSGWRRITWPPGGPSPLWVRHRFDEWMNP